MVSWEYGIYSESNHLCCIFQCTKLPCSYEVSAVSGVTLSFAVGHSGSRYWAGTVVCLILFLLLEHLPMLLMNSGEERNLKKP